MQARVTVRAARTDDAPGIARVHVNSWRTTYRGIVPNDYLASLSYERGQQIWERTLSDPKSKELVYVAEDTSGQIVGFASGGPERENDPVYKGELYAIYILDRYQQQGIGRRLTLAVVDGLAQGGLRSMLVWVLAENPSRRFYEVLGGQPVCTRSIAIGGVTLDEIAYGWTDITVLASAGQATG